MVNACSILEKEVPLWKFADVTEGTAPLLRETQSTLAVSLENSVW